MAKTFRIYTLGCKVNQYDSQNLREKLVAAGMREAAREELADLCIVNSCTVTAKAERESLYQVRRCLRDNPGARVVLTGCVVARRGEKFEGVHLALANADKREIIPALRKAFPRLAGTGGKDDLSGEAISFFQGRTRAFLKIQDGCDNFCAFCRVPFVRGKPVSKPLQAVVSEARALAGAGYKEIALTGICLGKYGVESPAGPGLVDVIEALEPLDGLARLRLSSIESCHVTPRLIGTMKAQGKLCPHLHIPLQSGDDRILARMSRPYTAARYCSLIRKLRKAVAEFSLTTDVIVGFPGETESAFRHTQMLIRDLQPLKAHIFPFSPRPGTAAAGMSGHVAPEEVRERILRLEETAQRAGAEFRSRFAGKRMEVLVEGRSRTQPGCWQGYTRNYLEVTVKDCRRLANTLRMVRIPKPAIDIR